MVKEIRFDVSLLVRYEKMSDSSLQIMCDKKLDFRLLVRHEKMLDFSLLVRYEPNFSFLLLTDTFTEEPISPLLRSMFTLPTAKASEYLVVSG